MGADKVNNLKTEINVHSTKYFVMGNLITLLTYFLKFLKGNVANTILDFLKHPFPPLSPLGTITIEVAKDKS